jgi:hypothetical protein
MRLKNAYFSVLILAAGGAVSFAIAVEAQTPSSAEAGLPAQAGITFPVPELGNCGSKDECRSYCNEPQNIPACVKFAKEHGLMNQEEAARGEKLGEKLSRGEGPGGCRTPQECRSFCSNLANIEACVKFAEEHGVKDKNVEEGKKILAYLRAGGALPGGCTSKESCEKYCGDFSHAEECFNFATRAGIAQARGGVPGGAEGRFEGGIPPGQFQKFLELVKRGETPGGCKSKNECEAYCRDSSRFEECVAFGEKAGFIPAEQAQKIRATGGFGPGGCDSQESCKAYCGEPVHREECFRFAEERGFINKEEIERAKEGLVHLRAGLEQAPPEVAACLKSTIGPNLIGDIQSGKLVPGPEIGERVRACQEKFGRAAEARRIFADAPPEVVSCLKEKLGDSFEKARSGETQPTPEMADTLRVCLVKAKFIEGGATGAAGSFAPGPQAEPSRNTFYDFLRNAPPGMVECLQKNLGDDYARFKAGEIQPGSDFKEKASGCFGEYRPTEKFAPPPTGERKPMPLPSPIGSGGAPNLPPQVLECVKSVAGPDSVRKLTQQGETAGDIGQAVRTCMQKFQESSIQPRKSVCPAMPTVSECPPGQERVVVFKSEECGVYYGCKGSSAAFPPRADGTSCVQVVTPAQNPETGECRKFPTPCDVPQGWKHGCENIPTTGSQTVDPTKLLQPFIAPLAPSATLAPDSAFVCRSLEECAKYCGDAASPYFKTAECEKFRSGRNVFSQ